MNGTEKVYALLKARGYLKTTEARGNGIDNKTMQRIADRGLIERIAHGVYVSSDTFPDPFFFAQYGG
jgi:predicted transcriptional regulator of viral defense system